MNSGKLLPLDFAPKCFVNCVAYGEMEERSDVKAMAKTRLATPPWHCADCLKQIASVNIMFVWNFQLPFLFQPHHDSRAELSNVAAILGPTEPLKICVRLLIIAKLRDE